MCTCNRAVDRNSDNNQYENAVGSANPLHATSPDACQLLGKNTFNSSPNVGFRENINDANGHAFCDGRAVMCSAGALLYASPVSEVSLYFRIFLMMAFAVATHLKGLGSLLVCRI